MPPNTCELCRKPICDRSEELRSWERRAPIFRHRKREAGGGSTTMKDARPTGLRSLHTQRPQRPQGAKCVPHEGMT